MRNSVLAAFALWVLLAGRGISQVPLQTPALLPGELAKVAAAGNQSTSQIARGGSQYLVVWTDTRSALNPLAAIGMYDGQGLGNLTDIYAARLDATGKVIDKTPIVVSQAQYNQTFPRVAWNGQNWLVTWMTEREENRFFYDIHAARVSPTGALLDTTPILVNRGEVSTDQYIPWDMESDGKNWIVVWRDLDAAGGIFTIDGARISPAGVLLDPNGKRLRRDSWNSGASDAQIAFANDEYLLTWLELDSSATWTVRGERLSKALTPIASPGGTVFTVNRYEPSNPRKPAVASDGDAFLVAWSEESVVGFHQLVGARISHTGQVLDPTGIEITPSAGYTLFRPSIAWDGSRYFVSYNLDPTLGNENVLITRVSAAGVVVDPSGIQVAGGNANQNEPWVTAGPGGGVQVVWTDLQRGGIEPKDILSASVSGSGLVRKSVSVSLGASRQSRPRIAAAGAQGFLAVLRAEVSGETRILAQLLDSNGAPVGGDPLRIAVGPPSLTNPSVAWNGAFWLVVWEDAAVGGGFHPGQVYGRRVLPDGTLLDPAPISILPGNEPDVAALGDQFLVVDTYDPTTEFRFTQSIRVDAAGVVLGAPLRIGAYFDVAPRVAAFGSRWLAVWEENVSHDNPQSKIVAAFVRADGTSPGAFALTLGPGEDTPHLAVAGNTALVAWASRGGDILGRRIRSDGTLIGGVPFVISDAPNRQLRPTVAWDGTRYVVNWLDQRNEGFPNQPRGDIFGARISAAGNVLDPAGFAIADSPLPEETPTVAAFNGRWVFAYSALSNQPQAAMRVVVRTN